MWSDVPQAFDAVAVRWFVVSDDVLATGWFVDDAVVLVVVLDDDDSVSAFVLLPGNSVAYDGGGSISS